MRIYLLTGGLVLLAAMPLAAQEATDSTRVFAVPASTPASPGVQELFIGAAQAIGTPDTEQVLGIAGFTIAGLAITLLARGAGRGGVGVLRSA